MNNNAYGGPVQVGIANGIATVTLNRPEVRNAISGALRRDLRAAMDNLEADNQVRAVILTGSDPAFCAGLDLRELGSSGSELAESSLAGSGMSVGSTSPFPPMTKPLIGAVNGPAITGGFELALNCDFLVASDRAAFADTHARVGVMPGWGLTALLAAAVGVRRAREISLTGNFVSASEALSWGLVNRVVAHDDLLPTARQLAADIAGNDQHGVCRMLATYAEAEEVALADAWRLEGEAARAFRSQVGFDAEMVAERRQGIIDRGSSQV